MLDTPYRVVRNRRTDSGGRSLLTTFDITRSGEGTLCYCDDVTFAYRIVELLNEEAHHAQGTATPDRHVHQGRADQGLVDTAA